MKLSIRILIAFFILSILPFYNFSQAQIYRYVDESGEDHYTNFVSSIPKKYHDSIVVTEEIDYMEPQSRPPENAQKKEEKPEKGKASFSDIESLRKQQQAFDREYQQLQKEKQALDKAQKEANTAGEVRRVNQKIKEFNQKLKDFHKRRKAFKQKVKEYNARVKKEMKTSLEKYEQNQKTETNSTAPGEGR